MRAVSRETLAFAIFAITFDQCRLADELNALPPDADDEHRSDTILRIERALGELRTLYAGYRDELSEQDNFDVLHANAEQDYRRFIESRGS